MKTSNNKWLVWRRHHDGQLGALCCTGHSTREAVESLQSEWRGLGLPTGLTHQVVYGGRIEAELAAARMA